MIWLVALYLAWAAATARSMLRKRHLADLLVLGGLSLLFFAAAAVDMFGIEVPKLVPLIDAVVDPVVRVLKTGQ